MPIKVQCPGCGKNLHGKDELAGKRVKCPKCGQEFAFPGVPLVSTPAPVPLLSSPPPLAVANADTPKPAPQSKRTRWPWFVGGVAVPAGIVLGSVIVFGLSGVSARGPLSVEIRSEGPPIVHYSPKYSRNLQDGEHLALHVFLSSADGRNLNVELASAGGTATFFFPNPIKDEGMSFATVIHKESGFLGYRFDLFDSKDTWFKNHRDIEFEIFGPNALRGSSLDWSAVSPRAKLSIAVATYREQSGDFVFQRFVSPVSVAQFEVPK